MRKLLEPTISVWIAFFVAACGSSNSNSGLGLGGGVSAGGSTAFAAKGGTAAIPGAGGSIATSVSSGSTGNPGTGGTVTGSSGGNASNPLGGSASTLIGGNTAGPTGGNTAGSIGGSTGSSGNSGAAGNAGAQGGKANGGAATGGTAGGSQAAGNTSTGGVSTTSEPKLITSAQNTYWQTGTVTELTSGTADVTVNDTSVAQDWNGFGGTFNEKGWDVLSLLDATERTRALKLLFDAQDGARFAYGRVPIGASDYAMSRYTLNETANDYTMTNFSIARDREKLIPFIKAALAIRSDIRFWASPWTPPSWMKDNNAMDGGNMKDDAQVLTAHALYLAKFVEEYAKEGIPIAAIHPQNEPGYETRYPSCLWTASLLNKFIRDYLGPAFATRSVSAEIWLGTMSNADSGKDGTIISTVTGDSNSMKFIKGFGLQWNMLDSVAGLKSRNLPIIQTEHKCGNYPWETATFNANQAPNDYAYAVESWGLITSWVRAGVNSYSAWNMVLDTAGKNLDSTRPWPQNALLTVDTTTKKLAVTPAYYVFRHVAQYVDPGAKRVGTTGGDALAFKNPDGTIVTILYNSGNTAKATILGVASKKLQFSIPANGWATVNWK